MKYVKIICGLAVAALVAYTFYYLYQQSKPKETVYEILEPQVRDLMKKTLATGRLEPKDEVNIKPKIQGIVTELYVQPGDRVEDGSPIAKISVIPEISALANAQSNLRNCELGMAQTQRDFDRTKTLYEKHVASKEEYEKAATELERVKEQLAAARDQVEIITRGISARSGSVNTTIVTSTVAGTVLSLPVKVGSSVQQTGTFNEGTTVAVVANMADIIFRGNIDETEVGKLIPGMPINILVGAIRDVTLPATLEYISPKGTDNNGAVNFEIKAAVQIPDTLTIRAGYSANADIILEERRQVLAVPETCIEMTADSTFVYVLAGDETAVPQAFERRPIKVGMSDGVFIEVVDGLTKDDRLRGNEKD